MEYSYPNPIRISYPAAQNGIHYVVVRFLSLSVKWKRAHFSPHTTVLDSRSSAHFLILFLKGDSQIEGSTSIDIS